MVAGRARGAGTMQALRAIAIASVICAVVLLRSIAPASGGETVTGPVTNLPLPRYVSLKSSKANVRRGPSLSHRIDWVYRRRDLPLKVVAEYGHWRRVEDRDGLGGWVHYSLLSGVRTALVDADETALRMKPVDGAPEAAMALRGVIARVDRCAREWCAVRAGGYYGWAPKHDLWGVGADEIID